MDAVNTVWAATLAIVVVVVVPLATALLHRTLRAALSIRRYLDEMLTAGVGIAGNTSAVRALDDTLGVAGSMLEVAGQLQAHSATIASVLAERAAASRSS
ncbi:MAG TPA: hypothetical protein VFS49_07515, partial [Croceibacterium sp.]|nr:hypothetical protein [Croceibacterium sp.]